MAKTVKIEVGDKVCVEFDGDPFMGVVSDTGGDKCTIGFDDGSTKVCLLKEVKLISKAGAPEVSDDITQSAKKTQAASPNAQQLADRANVSRKGKVDAANKATAAKEAAEDKENAGKPLTTEEEQFMVAVKAKLNGREYRANDVMVRTARMTSLPSSADLTRYARLLRQKEG